MLKCVKYLKGLYFNEWFMGITINCSPSSASQQIGLIGWNDFENEYYNYDKLTKYRLYIFLLFWPVQNYVRHFWNIFRVDILIYCIQNALYLCNQIWLCGTWNNFINYSLFTTSCTWKYFFSNNSPINIIFRANWCLF